VARIRSIKPEFFTSEQIVECSTNARLLFVGMWCFSDDAGIHQASVNRLKMEVFPADDFTRDQIAEWINELKGAGLIHEYEVDGESYWKVTGWEKHQRIDQPTFRFPNPDGFVERSPNRRRVQGEQVTNTSRSPSERSPSVRHGSGEERKGSNTSPTRGSIHGFPAGFEEFWDVYPRKVAKQDAVKAFAKLKPDAAFVAVLVAAVKRHAQSEQWQRGIQFVPHPASWLNGRRWEDELPAGGSAKDLFDMGKFV